MSDFFPIDRRDFLKLAVTGAVFQTLNPVTGQQQTTSTDQVATTDAALAPDELVIPKTAGRRNWLGPNFWGNRLQDWELAEGRIECVSSAKGPDLRTVSLITREFAGDGEGGVLTRTDDGGFAPNPERVLRATVGRISPKGKGFAGFLLGAGAGKLDYRAAALVQLASGENGGIMAVVDTEGRTAFREHTDEDNHARYAEIPSETVKGPTAYDGQPVELTLEIVQAPGSGVYYLTLLAGDPAAPISTSTLAVPRWSDLAGGLMLVSASTSGPDGARFWFNNISTSGSFIKKFPERVVGPILGTLFSLNGPVMKLTAQLLPISESDPQEVKLYIRENDQANWREVGQKQVGPGYCATFRIADWDDSKDWQYRVTYADDGTGRGQEGFYTGVIRKDPRHSGRQISIGLYSCTTATARGLDADGGGRRQLPGAREIGRYTRECMYFPYVELISSAKHHDPDMLVFAGDQFYETNPTEKVKDEAPTLDYLYKYFLWLWSFREITRDRPTLVLVDDHDVYHGNLWGNNGRPAPEGNQDLGGFVRKAEWVNMVQATQCGHNPDPWDPTPVQQGIGVYYSAFKFGGVDFCLLEDRKFKTAPIQGSSLNMHVAELLGERQEKFIKDWGEQLKDADARICLTATLLACAQTSPQGLPVVDFDSNGYPPLARIHAVRLLRDANVLILSGDQHLASVIRLGDDTYTDGPIQFSGPAGSTSWTRWFEPKEQLANAGQHSHTGDFQDGYGNKMRVLAVANPSITFAEYRKHIKGRGQGIGDRNLKAEGYGIVKVDLDAREYSLECWRWDVDPAIAGAEQFPGWPMKFTFDEVARG